MVFELVKYERFLLSLMLIYSSMTQVLVCNYGPGGNAEGGPEYEHGEPGSNCPFGTKKQSDGLCD